MREGSQREREGVGERLCVRASVYVRVCVRLAIKQTLKSNQLSRRQLWRPKHFSCVRLYNILIKRTASFLLRAFPGKYIPNQNSRDGDDVQIPRLSSSAG